MHARTSLSLRIVLAGLVGVAAPAQAQQSLAPRAPSVDVSAPTRAQQTAPSQTSSAQVGPTMDAASVGVRQPVTNETRAPNAAPRRAGYGQPVALMVVGGAALLAGLIIGGGAGTAIAVGGAVVGLYGLYEFLQ
ncbi:MAG TPA: hypothetical protein VGP25_06490 [Gemmatimonadaceae bacterium]|jgi:predicted phage tail protein|nr:hypothetical protein [Gemmatimonadaceae bacterium]